MIKAWLSNIKKRYLIAIASVIAAISYALIEPNDLLPSQSVAGGQRTLNEEPDSYGQGIIYKQFSNKGRLQQKLISQRTEHYPHSAISRYLEPRITSIDNQGQPWHIQADIGDMFDSEKRVTLQHNVIIYPINPPPNQELLIETSVLNYYLDSQRAAGTEPVRISNNQTKIDALGFELWVADEQLHLKPQVETHYAPPAR